MEAQEPSSVVRTPQQSLQLTWGHHTDSFIRTMAISLAAALDDAFMLDSDVDNLANSVHYKYCSQPNFSPETPPLLRHP